MITSEVIKSEAINDHHSPQSSATAASRVRMTDHPMMDAAAQQDSGYDSANHDYPSPRSNSSTPSAISHLGKNARKLVDTINNLGTFGVEASGLPLPKLVVVGDQSSGKSSLIEAISEIKVPRKSGTCTRCVLKINLKHAEKQSWTLTLVKKYFFDVHGGARAPGDFRQWRQLKNQEEIARVIIDYPDVEEYLSRAQDALLCPQLSPDDQVAILNGNSRAQPSVKFCPNIVELDVTGPTVPDLTMYDLPGIINQASDDEADLPKVVQSLAKTYVTSPNTIVVLACPMSNDMENLTASKFVTEWGARDRTVGVLTKPDTLSAATEFEQWHHVLEGKTFRLGKGYFVTKQPNASELKSRISHAQARRNEMSFFQESPWSDTFAIHHPRFGTGALQAKLSSLLAEEIATCLPKIRTDLTTRLEEIREEVRHYPEPPANPYGTIMDLTQRLRGDIDRLLKGETAESNGISRDCHTHMDEFLAGLRKQQPLLVVGTGVEDSWRLSSQVITIDDSDDEQVVPQMSSAAGAKRAGSAMSNQESPTKRSKTRATPSRPAVEEAEKFTLDQIRKKVRDTTTSGVPSDSDPRAEDQLIKQSMTNWGTQLRMFLSAVHDTVERQLLEPVETHTRPWLNTQVPVAVENAIRRCFDEIYEAFEQACMRTLCAELYKPLTCNIEYLKYKRDEHLNFLRGQRELARKKTFLAYREHSTNKPLSSGPEREKKVALIKSTELGSDPMDAEVQVMSRVRAYYHLSAEMLVDSIGKKCQYEVLEELRNQVTTALPRGVGIDGADVECVANCRMLLTENPERERKRQELTNEQERLEKSLQMVHSMGRF